jgi:multidrug efflux system membrane fusion protein
MRRLMVVLLVLILAGGGVWWFVLRAKARTDTAERPRDIPVLVAEVRQRDVPVYLDGLGTVQASATVTVKPQVDGMLSEVLFTEGEDVRKGDVLAHIDPRSFQAALDQAVAKKAQDQANLANAKVDLVRYTKLAATAYTSAQQADTQRSTVAQLEAQVAQDQAAIDTAKVNLGYTTITAPIDGRTGLRQVDQGNVVHAADTTGIVVLTTLRPIAVLFTLPQQQLPQVVAAMADGVPEVLALPQDMARKPGDAPLDRGSLSVIDNQVDATTGTIKLKALFPNEHLQLWPGGFVTVRLRVRVDAGATVAPPAAVQRGPQGPFVYVVGKDLTAERRAIRVGHEDVGVAVIEDGLKPGERVVIDGAARLTDGVRVAIAQPPGATAGPDGTLPPTQRHTPQTPS